MPHPRVVCNRWNVEWTICWTIPHQPAIDWTGWVIAVAAFGVAISRRVNLIVILGLAGVAGYVLDR